MPTIGLWNLMAPYTVSSISNEDDLEQDTGGVERLTPDRHTQALWPAVTRLSLLLPPVHQTHIFSLLDGLCLLLTVSLIFLLLLSLCSSLVGVRSLSSFYISDLLNI